MTATITLDRHIASIGSLDDKTYGKARKSILKAGRQAVPSLVAQLSNEDYLVRCRAAMILGYIGGDDIYPHLAALLNDSDPAVRYDALIAMGKLRDARAIPVLTAEFEKHDDTHGFSSAAASSLMTFGIHEQLEIG